MSDITFGEVEETPLKRERRPDQNRRFAVAACQAPADGELPVFVDLDALMDMEFHALTDTSVELGGVMLGGQYVDDVGQPFVVVTDNLRAAHYEATKGSFKFTHDTWQQISRERDEFPAELQMVGWYHTHPDWGVFLSGMDTFICDHFFNRPLDVALVIDPCRQDRGWFQWTNGAGSALRRTGGFFLFTSRYRAEELAQFAAQLEEQIPMRITPSGSSAPSGSAAPIVNIHEDKPGWIGSAVVGILAVQFCLILFGFYALSGGGFGNTRLADLEEKVKELRDREAALDAKAKAIDSLISGLKQGPEKATELLSKAEEEAATLRAKEKGVKLLEEERDQLKTDLEARTSDLKAAEKVAKTRKEALDEKTREHNALKEQYAKLREEKGAVDAASWLTNPYVMAGFAAGGVLIAGIAMAFLSHRPNGFDKVTNSSKESSRESDRELPTMIDEETEIKPPK